MTHTLAEEYLERLDRAAAHHPRARRRALVDELEAHIVEALGPEPSEVEVRNVLERLGTPEEIVDAEAPRPAPRPRMGTKEWVAVVTLALGMLTFGLGWIVGLVLLLASRAWTVADKVVGTVLFAGTIVLVPALSLASGLSPFDLLIFLFVVPLAGAVYLAARADLNRSG